MIAKYPWFGPKNGYGWGWTPVSREGWAVTILCVVPVLVAPFVFGPRVTVYIAFGSVAVLLIVCFLTGTAPG
jgi:hypothetical protein